MNKRNTKQKNLIIETLKNDKTHPTIRELYIKIKDKDSSIGQATVYRNVNKLLDSKDIIKMQTSDGVDHYDGNCNPHYHLKCKNCGKIIDIFDNSFEQNKLNIEKKYFVKIDNTIILFEGICDECIN